MTAKKTGKSDQQRGRSLTAPEKTLTINGAAYKLVFNNATIRRAEDVYAEKYGKDIGFSEILKQLASGRYAAIMALLYAAMAEGGVPLPWEEFDRDFRVTGIAGARDVIMQGVIDSMPVGDSADPQPTPGTKAPIPGRG